MNIRDMSTTDSLAQYVIPHLQNSHTGNITPEPILSAIRNILFNKSNHGAAALSLLMQRRFDLFLQITDNWQTDVGRIPQAHWISNPGNGIPHAIIPFIQRIQNTQPGSLLSVVAQQATSAGCQAIASILLLILNEGILEADFSPFMDPKKFNVYVDTTTHEPTLTTDNTPLPFILFMEKLTEDATSRILLRNIAAHFSSDQDFCAEAHPNIKLIQALHQDTDNPQHSFQTWVKTTWPYVDYEILYENLASLTANQLQPWFIQALKTLLSDEHYIVFDDDTDDESDIKQTLAHQLWLSHDGIKTITFLNNIDETHCTDKTAWLRKVLDNCNSPYVICSVVLAIVEDSQQSNAIGSVFYTAISNARTNERLDLARSLRQTVSVGPWMIKQFQTYADAPLNEEVLSTYIFHKTYASHGKRKSVESVITLRSLIPDTRLENLSFVHTDDRLSTLLGELTIDQAAACSSSSSKKSRAETPTR